MKELSYLAIRLKEARKKAGMSAYDAGQLVARSDSTIYAWENGTSEPSAEQLVMLCRAYGVDITYFYPPEAATGNKYSKLENKIVERYRALDDEDKAVFYGLLEILGRK